MKRRIIKIDENLCNGCGLCATACHEGAIHMVDGKARLLREDYCDGLGDCLPACPAGAISFEEREALAYDETAVKAHLAREQQDGPGFSGCPGSRSQTLKRTDALLPEHSTVNSTAPTVPSQLAQWPVQIKLVPVNAPYFEGANLLIAADCTAYSYGNFHEQFMKGKVTLIGCPKLDEGDYSEKLTAILANNNIKSVTIVRMEVPCCSGLSHAAVTALQGCGKMIPWQVYTLSTDGQLLEI